MCHSYAIEAVDRTLRDLMNNSLPFRGKLMVFCGDFRQILPVVIGGNRGQIVAACLKRSVLYPMMRKLTLSKNMRLAALREDPNADVAALQYPSYLLSVGEGREVTDEDSRLELTPAVKVTEDIREMENDVFGELRT